MSYKEYFSWQTSDFFLKIPVEKYTDILPKSYFANYSVSGVHIPNNSEQYLKKETRPKSPLCSMKGLRNKRKLNYCIKQFVRK